MFRAQRLKLASASTRMVAISLNKWRSADGNFKLSIAAFHGGARFSFVLKFVLDQKIKWVGVRVRTLIKVEVLAIVLSVIVVHLVLQRFCLLNKFYLINNFHYLSQIYTHIDFKYMSYLIY